MSSLLLERCLAHVRAGFTKAEVATVQTYGGEFSADEVERLSFNAPAILLTLVGWQAHKPGEHSRMAARRTREAQMMAFVVTKHARREPRMNAAMLIAEKLALVLRHWRPQCLPGDAFELAALDDEPSCENLYGRAIDKQGMALWLVRWGQCATPLLGDGEGADGSAYSDWLTTEILTTARETQAAPAAPAPLPPALVNKPVNTESIAFTPDPV